MGRFRFSISGLAALVLVAAIVLAAARDPNEAWCNGAFSLAVIAMMVAVLGAIFRRGAARAYWVGFAMMGWGYLGLAFGPWCDAKVAPLLITKTICENLHWRLQKQDAMIPATAALGTITAFDPAGQPVILRATGKTAPASYTPVQRYTRTIPGTNLLMFGYQQIGHSLTALLLALLGGVAARRFASRPEPEGDG